MYVEKVSHFNSCEPEILELLILDYWSIQSLDKTHIKPLERITFVSSTVAPKFCCKLFLAFASGHSRWSSTRNWSDYLSWRPSDKETLASNLVVRNCTWKRLDDFKDHSLVTSVLFDANQTHKELASSLQSIWREHFMGIMDHRQIQQAFYIHNLSPSIIERFFYWSMSLKTMHISTFFFFVLWFYFIVVLESKYLVDLHHAFQIKVHNVLWRKSTN